MARIQHSRVFALHVWGDLALFAQPHFRADPHTYPVLTPSAAKGLVGSIYAKPEMEWEVLRIHVLSPIWHSTARRSAMTTQASPQPERRRTLQTCTSLHKVEYVIEARIAVDHDGAGGEKGLAGYEQEVLRRMRACQQFRQPYFGSQENIAYWELLEDELPAALPLDMGLGSILFDMMPVDMAKDQWMPIFCRARLQQGVLHVPQDLYDWHRAHLMASRDHDKRYRHAENTKARKALGPPPTPPGPCPVVQSPTGPAATMLDALVERGSASDNAPPGYETIKARYVLKLDGQGGFRGVEVLKPPRLCAVPKYGRSGAAVNAKTAIDTPIYALGVDASDRGAACHAGYLEMLRTIDHPAARAVLTFLQSSRRPVFVLDKKTQLDPDGVQYLAASPSERILIEVEGHPDWWLDEAVRTVHKRRLVELNNKGDGLEGSCSLCGQQGALARLFPKSRLGSLISFNESAWEGYGRRQGYCAPTCPDCVDRLTLGMDAVTKDRGTCRRQGEDVWLLWWPTDHNSSAPWPLLDKALKAETEADAEEALAQLTDGHFAVVEKMMGRLALRRYATVSGATVASNLRQWRATFDSASVWAVATALARPHPDGPRPKGQAFDRYIEMLYCALVGNEPVAELHLNRARSLLLRDAPNYRSRTNRHRTALLQFADNRPPEEASVPTDPDTKEEAMPTANVQLFDPHTGSALDELTANERCAYYAGRAFGRADYVQRINRRPQRSLAISHYTPASRDIHLVRELVTLHAVWRSRNRQGPNRDSEAHALVHYALEAVGGKPPRRFNRVEATQFYRGFTTQDALHRERQEAHKAQNNINSAQSATNATTDSEAVQEQSP